MVPTRRAFLVAATLVPASLVAARLAAAAGDGLRAVATSMRPPAAGSSAARCGLCGSADHTMLDPDCPMTPRVGARSDG